MKKPKKMSSGLKPSDARNGAGVVRAKVELTRALNDLALVALARAIGVEPDRVDKRLEKASMKEVATWTKKIDERREKIR